MKIIKDSPVPYYHQLVEIILDKIKKGSYKVGELIPTELDLEKIYGVSRTTIRMAIKKLVDLEYVEIKRGKGTFVKRQKAIQNLNLITSWAETILNIGMSPGIKSIKISKEPAKALVAKLLNIKEGKMLYKLYRVRTASGEPACLMTNFLLPEIVPGFTLDKFISGSLYRTLETKYNIILKRASEKIEAMSASKKQASLLNVKEGFPLLHIQRVTYDESDNPIELVLAYTRGDMFAYEINLFDRPKK